MNAKRSQIEMATEVVDEIHANGFEGLDVLVLLDSLACAGIALVRPTDRNIASEAYLEVNVG